MAPLELLERMERWAKDSPGRVAFSQCQSDRQLTFGELRERVRALSGEMARKVGRGSVVMLRCGNQVEYPVWFLALLARGARVFPVSVELTETEVRGAAQRARVTMIVEGEEPSPRPSPGVPGEGERPDGAELLLASSGTTGQQKIVARCGASLDAVARNMVEAIGFSQSDRVLASVPLTHSYGLEHGLLAPLWAGSSVRLCEGLDLPVVTRELADGATLFPAVPAMIEMLAATGEGSLRIRKLRVAYSAGGPLPREVYERFHSRFGVRVGQLYGMTEIGSVTFSDPSSRTFDPASVGVPMRDVSVRLLEMPGGGEKEIAVKAPSMFRGYLGEDGARLVDGHFATGDLGRVDESGNITLTGRVRLLIDAGGMKVNPIEVESVLATHPDVMQCVVVPVRQSETVRRLRAVIVPRDVSSPPTSDAIRKFARERLAGYKVPRVVEFRASLPTSATGKVLRHLLEVL